MTASLKARLIVRGRGGWKTEGTPYDHWVDAGGSLGLNSLGCGRFAAAIKTKGDDE